MRAQQLGLARLCGVDGKPPGHSCRHRLASLHCRLIHTAQGEILGGGNRGIRCKIGIQAGHNAHFTDFAVHVDFISELHACAGPSAIRYRPFGAGYQARHWRGIGLHTRGLLTGTTHCKHERKWSDPGLQFSLRETRARGRHANSPPSRSTVTDRRSERPAASGESPRIRRSTSPAPRHLWQAAG